MQFPNDPRHIASEVEESKTQTRTATVAFFENRNLLHKSEFTIDTVLFVNFIRGICAGEELSVSYEEKYSFDSKANK